MKQDLGFVTAVRAGISKNMGRLCRESAASRRGLPALADVSRYGAAFRKVGDISIAATALSRGRVRSAAFAALQCRKARRNEVALARGSCAVRETRVYAKAWYRFDVNVTASMFRRSHSRIVCFKWSMTPSTIGLNVTALSPASKVRVTPVRLTRFMEQHTARGRISWRIQEASPLSQSPLIDQFRPVRENLGSRCLSGTGRSKPTFAKPNARGMHDRVNRREVVHAP